MRPASRHWLRERAFQPCKVVWGAEEADPAVGRKPGLPTLKEGSDIARQAWSASALGRHEHLPGGHVIPMARDGICRACPMASLASETFRPE